MSQKQDVVYLSNLVHLGSVTVKDLLVQEFRSCCRDSSSHVLVRPTMQIGMKRCYWKETALAEREHEAEIHGLIDYGCEL